MRQARSPDGLTTGTFPVRPLLILCATQLIFVAAFQMAGIALPEIQADLGVGDAALPWVNSALALSLAALLLPAGRLVDRFGGRPIFRLGAGGLVLTSLAAAGSRSLWQLVAARAVQGAALALLLTAMFALITHLTPEPAERVKALTWWGVAGSIGGAAGVLIGGGLLSAAGWPAVFLLIAVATAPVALLSSRLPATGVDRGRSLDIPGAALAGATMAAAVLGLVLLAGGNLAGAALLGLAALLTAGLVAVERRVAQPLVPLEIVARRPFAGVSVVSVLHAAVTNTPLYFFTIYMQGMDGRSAAATGLAFVPCNLALVAGSAAGGRLVPRIAPARTAALGVAVVAVGHLAMVRLPATDGYLTAFLPEIVLLGLGLGIPQVAIATAITSGVPTSYAGFASSAVSATNQVGTAVGLAILVGVAAASGGNLADRETGYRWVFGAAAMIAVATASLTRLLFRPAPAQNRAERTNAGRPAGHPAR